MFELERVLIEAGSRESRLAARILSRLGPGIAVEDVADGREAAKPLPGVPDPFGAGKRRMILMRRRSPFLMACPAGSSKFACCGYLVLVLASNCPMDCSYCFLQDYLANNPGFQLYTNYAQAFAELEALIGRSPGRHFRVGTGELADSLAFDGLTGLSLDLVEFFSRQSNLTLELKTKTAEIDNLLTVEPRGQVLVSWTLSPQAVFRQSEHRTAAPAERIDAARRLLEAGYRVGFHLDPLIAYEQAERDYPALLDELFAAIDPRRISFISLGAMRMTPGLRAAARARFARDPMLLGEEVLAGDGRFRAFVPMRTRLYRLLAERIRQRAPGLATYLCMETSAMSERVFGPGQGASPAQLSERLATS